MQSESAPPVAEEVTTSKKTDDAPVEPAKENGQTCDKLGYTKFDRASGSEAGSLGTLTWSGRSLTYVAADGITADLCVKGGSVEPIHEINDSDGITYTHPQGISHVGYRDVKAGSTPPPVVVDPDEDDACVDQPGNQKDDESCGGGNVTPPPAGAVVQKITLCHATSSATNPYVIITPSVFSVVKNNGHDEHTKQNGRIDIIPPFRYLDKDGTVKDYPGRGWDAAGQAFFAAGCQAPAAVAPDLSVDKSGPSTGVPGSTGQYKIVARNAGTVAVTEPIVVTDELPVGETATAASGDGFTCDLSSNARLVTCTSQADLAPGAAASTITVAVSYATDASGDLTDTARVKAVTGETNTGNNQDTVTTTVTAQIVQEVTLCHATGSNSNPYVQISPSVNSVVKANGHDQHQDRRDIIPPFTYDDKGTITQYPGLNWDAAGQALFANGCKAPALVAPDLAVDKSGPATGVVGGTGSYTLVASNAGTVAVTDNIIVVDTLPAGESATAASGAGFTCVITNSGATVTCTRTADLAAGTSADPITVSVSYTATGSLTDVANVVPVTGEINTTNNRDEVTTVVTAAPVTDLRIVKTDDVADSSTVEPGDAFSYTIRVVNDGGLPVAGFVVRDTLPAELRLRGLPAGTGFSCDGVRALVCTFAGSLPPGTSVTLTVPVILSEAYEGTTVVNTATVPLAGDPTPGNNTDTETTPVVEVLPEPPASVLDLRIVKTDSVESVRPGDPLTYTLTVINDGGAAVSGFTVTDTLPVGTTLSGASGNGFACTGTTTISCTYGPSLVPGAAASLTLTVLVDSSYTADTVVNTATVPLDGDPTPGNNTDTETTPVVEVLPEPPANRPDLSMLKSDNGATVRPGDSLIYTLTTTNEGLDPVTSFVVTDQLPAGLTLNSVSGNGFACNTTASALACTFSGSLAPGARAVLTVNTTVSASYTGSEILNTAVIQPLPDEDNTGNNSSTERTPVVEVLLEVFDRPAPPAQVDELPFTGSDTGTLLSAALGMLLLGVAAQLVGSRTRRVTAHITPELH